MASIFSRECHTAGHNTDGTPAKQCACWWKPTSPTTPLSKPGTPSDVARHIQVGGWMPSGMAKTYFALDWRWKSPWPNDGLNETDPRLSHDYGWIFNHHNTAWDNGNTGQGGIGWAPGFGNPVSSVTVAFSGKHQIVDFHVEPNSPAVSFPLTCPPADSWQSLMWEVTWGRKTGDAYLNSLALGAVGRVRVWQNGGLTLDTNTVFPGGVNTVQVATNPSNGLTYIQGWIDFWQGSTYILNWNVAADGIVEQTAARIGSTAAACLGDTSISANTFQDATTTYEAAQGAPSPNGHGGNSWETTPVTGVRDTSQFIVPAEFATNQSIAPVNTVAPAISGTVSLGNTLTCSTGTWTASPSPTYTYQWQMQYDASRWFDITSATASTLVVASAHVGVALRCKVTAANTIGTAVAPTAATIVVAGSGGNWIGNGDFESVITGWTANIGGETVTRTTSNTDAASVGAGQFVTVGNVGYEGMFTPIYQATGQGIYCPSMQQRSLSTRVRAANGVSIRVAVNYFDATDKLLLTARTLVTGNGSYQTVAVTAPGIAQACYQQVSVTTGSSGVSQASTTVQLDNVTFADVASTSTAPVVNSSGSFQWTSNTGTKSITVPGGLSNSALYVLLSYDDGNRQTTNCQWGATGLTLVKRQANLTTGGIVEVWRLLSPTAATANLSVTNSNTVAMVGGYLIVTSVNQTTPESATAGASGTTNSKHPTLAVTTSTGSLVIGALYYGGDPNTLTADSGQSDFFNLRQYTNFGTHACGTTKSGSGSVTLGWTTTSANSSAIAAANVSGTVVAAPVNTVAPTVMGSTTRGSRLTAATGTWTNTPDFYSYQWQIETAVSSGVYSDIDGATQAQYVTDDDDLGLNLRVTVIAANAGGAASASSAGSGAITVAIPTNTGAPVAFGATYIGDVVSCGTGSWTDAPTSYSYQWQSDDGKNGSFSNIGGATSATYTTLFSDNHRRFRCLVTATNAAGSSSAATSSVNAAIARANTYESGNGVDENPVDEVWTGIFQGSGSAVKRAGNRLMSTAASGTSCQATATGIMAKNGTLTATLSDVPSAATKGIGIYGRLANPGASFNAYAAVYLKTTGIQLYKVVAGGFTKLGADYTTHALAQYEQLQLDMQGTTIKVNWVATDGTVTNAITQTDSGVSAAGTVGIEINDVAASIGDVSITASHPYYTTQRQVFIPSAYDGTDLRLDQSGFGADSSVALDMTLRDQWQRATLTFKPVATTTGLVRVREYGFAPSTNAKVYVDWAQTEEKPFPTPYTATSRLVGFLSGDFTTLSSTRMWFAIRLRMGFPAIVARTPNAGTDTCIPFIVYDDGSNMIGCQFDEATLTWQSFRFATTKPAAAISAADTFAIGDFRTIMATFDSTHTSIGRNGDSLVTVANTAIPTLASTSLDIASFNLGETMNSDVMWAAAGTGPVSANDYQLVVAYGNALPIFPSSMVTKLAWAADTSTYATTSVSGGIGRTMTGYGV